LPGTYSRLRTARRVFGLVPVLVFLLTFILLAQQFNSPADPGTDPTFYLFLDILLRSLAASLTSGVLCIGAYGFYRYLIERSPGL
jgi:ABC-type Fe3+ transport system permease subunit